MRFSIYYLFLLKGWCFLLILSITIELSFSLSSKPLVTLHWLEDPIHIYKIIDPEGECPG